MKTSHFAAAIVLASVSAPAWAQSQPDAPAVGGDRLSIGAGAVLVPSYEGSNNYDASPGIVVQGSVDGHDFWTRGLNATFDLLKKRDPHALHLQFGPTVNLNLNRSGRIADDQVRALGKVKAALEVGGFVGVSKMGVLTSDYDTLSVRLSVTHDVTGIHDSTIFTPSINYGTPLSRTAYVGVSGSVDIVGDGYADTYFSVDPAGSAASGLPVYSAKGGLKSYSLNLFAARSLSGGLTHGWALFAAGGYKRLLNDFSASPIVSVAGSANQWFGGIGVGYTF